MKNIIPQIEKYLYDTLNIKIKTQAWKGQSNLPIFLTNIYNYLEFSLLKKTCLMVIAKKGTEESPAAVRKHIEQIMQKWEGPCIYVQTEISPHNRKRLIEHKVPFIIPNCQIYLPDFGIVLQEHSRRQRTHKTTLSPATQALIILTLLNRTSERLLPSEIAKKLGYSLMTMTRSFNELEDASIGEMNRKGKERWWTYKGSKRDLWEQTKSMLRSPVKKRVWIKHKKLKILSGLSALAQISMIAEPSIPIYAIGPEGWKMLKKSGIQTLPSSDGATINLEIWSYDPILFAKDQMVDLFSLYLSLEGDPDVRIEIALKELMEKIEW